MSCNKKPVRLRFDISDDVNEFLLSEQNENGVTSCEVLRRGISVLKLFREQSRLGRGHLGFTANPSDLDAEISFLTPENS